MALPPTLHCILRLVPPQHKAGEEQGLATGLPSWRLKGESLCGEGQALITHVCCANPLGLTILDHSELTV